MNHDKNAHIYLCLFQNPEDQLEYPIIERTFFVQFMFLADSENKAEICPVTVGGSNAPSTHEDTERKQLEEITKVIGRGGAK